MTVVKRSGQRELFDRNKLFNGVMRACEKTGLGPTEVNQLVDSVESELQGQPLREVLSLEIGRLALAYLQPLNQVAYIRFASVYSQFQTIQDFVAALQNMGPLKETARSTAQGWDAQNQTSPTGQPDSSSSAESLMGFSVNL
jgi:transcriptional repressor NrdR